MSSAKASTVFQEKSYTRSLFLKNFANSVIFKFFAGTKFCGRLCFRVIKFRGFSQIKLIPLIQAKTIPDMQQRDPYSKKMKKRLEIRNIILGILAV